MSRKTKDLSRTASRSEVDAFLNKVALTPKRSAPGERGRLIFAMDATASRGPTWDQAMQVQAGMFNETRRLGGLDIQLCYYRGFMEFHASPWCADADELLRRMTAVFCAAGQTQIARVLQHVLDETRRGRVHALVLVGDCMEENASELARLAGELGLLGVPAFIFQEGYDPAAERVFRELARLSGGAYSRFDRGSPGQLRDLLSAVAVYAAGGSKALEDFGRARGGLSLRLTHQIHKG